MELSDVLNDKEPTKTEAVETPAPTEAPEPERAQSRRAEHRAKEDAARGRDPATGKFTPKEEPKVEVKEEPKVEPKVQEPKREEFTDKERAFLRGLEEERRKRQDLERQLSEIRAAQQQPGEKKTFWDDPEGHFKNFQQNLEKTLTQREINAKFATSEAIARSRYTDFDDKVQVFAQLMRDSPGLQSQMLSAPDPGEFVYRTAERTMLLRDAGGLDQLMAKKEKEIRAKLEAEYKAKQDAADKQRAELTGSLSEVRGASTKQVQTFTGPTPLEDILGRK